MGNWFIYFGNQKINKKWNWHNEVQYRNYNFIGDLNQLLLRTGIGYNLTENNNNILLGYGFIHTERYLANAKDKIAVDEHRIYQQFITKQNFNRVFIQHRYRIEERFLPNDFQIRFRYFVSLNIPLNNKTMIKNTVYASAYNEIFLNGKATIFDRNRLYAGMGYVLNKNIKVELGFMAQTLEQTNRNQFQIIVFNNLPLKNN
jgi:long-subunit fatty acid transport protein